MRLTSVLSFLVAAGAHATSPAQTFAGTGATGDYPTFARAEYVFACMKSNGDTREALQQCSCSIDVIASLIPYDAYVAGETVASMKSGAWTNWKHVPRRQGRARRPRATQAGSGGGRSAVFLAGC